MLNKYLKPHHTLQLCIGTMLGQSGAIHLTLGSHILMLGKKRYKEDTRQKTCTNLQRIQNIKHIPGSIALESSSARSTSCKNSPSISAEIFSGPTSGQSSVSGVPCFLLLLLLSLELSWLGLPSIADAA